MTETSWFDDGDLQGPDDGLWRYRAEPIPDSLDWNNAGGYAAVITVMMPEDDEKKSLLDTGWNTDWMDYAYRRHSVEPMLEHGEMAFMVLSHWHLDRFWGTESALKHMPQTVNLRWPGRLPRSTGSGCDGSVRLSTGFEY